MDTPGPVFTRKCLNNPIFESRVKQTLSKTAELLRAPL